jgi:hypothetical protein
MRPWPDVDAIGSHRAPQTDLCIDNVLSLCYCRFAQSQGGIGYEAGTLHPECEQVTHVAGWRRGLSLLPR